MGHPSGHCTNNIWHFVSLVIVLRTTNLTKRKQADMHSFLTIREQNTSTKNMSEQSSTGKILFMGTMGSTLECVTYLLCFHSAKESTCTVCTHVFLPRSRRYKDDPTILAWNLINEPRCDVWAYANCTLTLHVSFLMMSCAFSPFLLARILSLKRVPRATILDLWSSRSGL